MQRWKIMFSREKCLYIIFWKIQASRNCFNRCLLFESVWIIIWSNFVIFFSLFCLCFSTCILLTFPSLDVLNDETDHAGRLRGSVVKYLGWKYSLFLHTFFKSKQHTKVILFFWLTPPLTHSSSSQPSSTSHEKQWKSSSSVLETKKYFYLFSIKYSGSTRPLARETFWAGTLRLDQQLLNFNFKK